MPTRSSKPGHLRAGSTRIQSLQVQEVQLLPRELQARYFSSCPNLLFGHYGVHGDGTCFFHSLCAATNKRDYLHQSSEQQQQIGHKFRCAFTDHLTDERWDRFLKLRGMDGGGAVSGAQARKQFCSSKTWADEVMIKYVSDVMKLNLIFIDTQTGQIYCGVRGKTSEPLIIILWIDHSHFEPLFCIRDANLDEDKLAVQFEFDATTDENVVNAIMQNYQAQCAAK